jgi:hypothetical protein
LLQIVKLAFTADRASLRIELCQQRAPLRGADQLQRQIDRRLALYAQQQAVRAVIQAWQAEQKLRVGLAALTE